MVYEDTPDPIPVAGEVLVRIKAASVNRGDMGVVSGGFGPGAGLPMIPGWEVSGTVEAAAGGVSTPAVGERVIGYAARGGYAELIALPVESTRPVPENLSFEEAASVPVVFVSAWYALVERAKVQPGETVLVHSAASGVGMAAVQLAKHLGASVIATAGSEAKVAFARELGADHAINYTETDFGESVKEITGGKGVDVAVDVVGGEIFEKSLRSLGRGGRMVSVGNSSRTTATIDPNWLLRGSLTIMGMQTGLFSKPGGDRPILDQILRLLADGRLYCVVDRSFPLAEAAASHRYLMERRNLGKVVLVP